MSNSWPHVPLGELLTRSEKWTDLSPTETYREITVRLWGKGVTLRREATGAEIASARRLVARAGQFILSRIDARNEPLGLVPEALDGAVVSNDFPVFTPNLSRLLPRFLDWISKTRSFVEICKAASEGTTNRVRLQEDRFLKMTIPLPPLSEQRRIEELAAKINEARGLRAQAIEEAEGLCRSVLIHDRQSRLTPMNQLLRLRAPDVVAQADDTYQFAGVYCFGRGVFRASCKSGIDFAYERLTRLRKGDFVYPKLMAWEGALGIVPDECAGCVVSPEFPVFEVLQDRGGGIGSDFYILTVGGEGGAGGLTFISRLFEGRKSAADAWGGSSRSGWIAGSHWHDASRALSPGDLCSRPGTPERICDHRL